MRRFVLIPVVAAAIFLGGADSFAQVAHDNPDYSGLLKDRELLSDIVQSRFRDDLLYCQTIQKGSPSKSKASTWEDLSIEYSKKVSDSDEQFERLYGAVADKRRRASLAMSRCTAQDWARCEIIRGDVGELPGISNLLSRTSRLRGQEKRTFSNVLDCVGKLDDFVLERGDRKTILEALDNAIGHFRSDADSIGDLIKYQSAEY